MPAATDLPPSILSHVSVGTNDLPRAKAFYDAVSTTLQIGVVMEYSGAVTWLPVSGIKSAYSPLNTRASSY
jgi:hypothetical protein